jgi:hypothetical protein
MEEDWSLPDRSDLYVKDLIQEKFKRIRTIWRRAQLRIIAAVFPKKEVLQ